MIKFKLFVVLMFLCLSLYANGRIKKFSCQINRSMSLIITVGSDYDSILLQTKYYEDQAPKDIAVLQSPHIIDHGNTFIVVSDNGKSGYVLIRIQEKLGDPDILEYEGVLDINLYSYDDNIKSINTNGFLTETFCYNIK